MPKVEDMTEEYRYKILSATVYQDFAVDRLIENGIVLVNYRSMEYQHNVGENMGGVEIKNDKLFSKTGNLYIEMYEKCKASNEDWVKSGILRDDNTWLYILGDYEKMFIFSKKQLKRVSVNCKIFTINEGTSKGFILPIEDAKKKGLILKTIKCKEKENGRY